MTAETGALQVLPTHQVSATCPQWYPNCGFLSPTPVARGVPTNPSRSAYPRTGGPSRPPRRARPRARLG